MSAYIRQPLLNTETEKQLKKEMLPLWEQGIVGSKIAKQLQFEVKGTKFFKVKKNYVYFYRQKFNFPIRRKPSFAKGEPRYKNDFKELDLMSVEEFVETLNEKLPFDSFYCRRARAYLILHYWTPLRASEIYERKSKDFKITPTKIIIKLLRKKKKHKPTDKKEPISILRGFPLVEETVSWLQNKEWKHDDNTRPFEFGRTTARNYTLSCFDGYYPHYFRFRFLTHGANDPMTSIAELKAKSCLTLSALEYYIKSPQVIEDQYDRRQLERLKEKGVI